MPIFDDPLHDEFGSWILGFAPYGGGDVGEVERAFWTNAAPDLPALVAELWKWTLAPEILADVTTPILVASAEGDRASTDTDQLFAAPPGPKERMTFTAAAGAGMHGEMLNRSLANRRILDWLDTTLR